MPIRYLIACSLLLSEAGCTLGFGSPRLDAAHMAGFHQQGVPEIAFDSVPDFLKLPENVYLGEAAGVAVNSKGHVFVFSRGNTTGPAYGATAAQLLEFDHDGNYLREIGKTFTPGRTHMPFE